MIDYVRKGFILIKGNIVDVDVFVDTLCKEFSYSSYGTIDDINKLDINHNMICDSIVGFKDVDTKNFSLKSNILIHRTDEPEYCKDIIKRVLELSTNYNTSIIMYQEDNIKGKAYSLYIGGGIVNHHKSREYKFAKIKKNELTSEFLKTTGIKTIAPQNAYKQTMPIIFSESVFNPNRKGDIVIVKIKATTPPNNHIIKKQVAVLFSKLCDRYDIKDFVNKNGNYDNFEAVLTYKINPIGKVKSKYDIFKCFVLNDIIEDLEVISKLSGSTFDIKINYKLNTTFDFVIKGGELM